MKAPTVLTLLALCAASVACQETPPARYGSSAAEPAYAERYPGTLSAMKATYQEDEQAAHKISTEFGTLPGELKNPDWKEVGKVIELADESGKNADFSQGMLESRALSRFYTEEKQGLQQKVAGSIQYTAKEKNCDVDFYGTTAGSLDRAWEKTVTERLRAHNAATRYIEDHVDAIGEANVPKLTKRADEIALASFLVHVQLPGVKADLDAMLAESSNVKESLVRQQADAESVVNGSSGSPAAKKVAKQRAEAASSALLGFDGAVSGAEQLSEALEQRTKASLDEYEKALDTLKDAVEKEADKQPAKDQ